MDIGKNTPSPTPLWRELTEEQKELINQIKALTRVYSKRTKDLHDKEWEKTWTNYKATLPRAPTVAQQTNISKKRLEIHETLAKAESSLVNLE